MNDRLTEQSVREYLGTVRHLGGVLECFDSIDSTNRYLKDVACRGGADGTVAIANAQTSGRGRRGRQFQSAGGKGIYWSVLLRGGLTGEQMMPFTALAGLAVCRSIQRVCGLQAGLKWPNDLLLEGKKVCGILAELVTMPGEVPAVVLGIGVNVSQTAADFTPEVAEIASSLEVIGGKPISRPKLAAAMIEEVDRVYHALLTGDWTEELAEYRTRCVHIGKQVRLLPAGGEAETVTVLDVDDRFGLVVQSENGEKRVLRTGEISVRPVRKGEILG